MEKELSRPAFLVETKSLRDLMKDLRKAELWLMIAAIAAFLASAFFVVKYFVGGEMTPTLWTTEQWMNAFLGLAITAVITAAQAFLYAAGYKGYAAIIGTVIVVFFGVFSEISQSMEREDETVKTRSENSPVFQAALGSIQNISQQAAVPVGSTALAAAQGKLARHEAELAVCPEKYTSASRIRRCENYERSKIAEAKGEIAAAQAAATASTAATTTALSTAITQAKSLQYDEDQHYAMIRLIKGMLGVTGIWASFLFSVIIIGTFEYAFHFVGSYVSDHKKALLLLGRDAHGNVIKPNVSAAVAAQHISTSPLDTSANNQPRTDYANCSSPTHDDAEKKTGNDVSNNAAESELPKNVHDLSHKRFFQLLYIEARTAILNGSVQPTVRPVTNLITKVIHDKAAKLGVKPNLIGKPQRQKIAETILMKLELETVIERNQKGGIAQPKYVLAQRYQQRNAQPETVAKSVDYPASATEPTSTQPQAKATTDDWTPGQPEKQFSMGFIDTNARPTNPARRVTQGNAGSNTQGQTTQGTQGDNTEAKTEADTPIPNLYAEWQQAIYDGKLAPQATASRKWLQQRIASDQSAKKTPTPKEISKTVEAYFNRACRSPQCRINLKPDYKNGQREKYILTA